MEEKNKIIERTEDKFFRDGFYKTTMDEIATDLSMSKKTIYKFFPSKEAEYKSHRAEFSLYDLWFSVLSAIL